MTLSASQDDLNLRILRMFEGAFSLDTAHTKIIAPYHTKRTIAYMQKTKTPVSMLIRTLWSGHLLSSRSSLEPEGSVIHAYKAKADAKRSLGLVSSHMHKALIRRTKPIYFQ